MEFNSTSRLPLFQQVAEQIEEAILNGSFKENAQIPSTTEISKAFQINPATILKGMNILVEQNVLVKQRGIGMFVVDGAQAQLQQQRSQQFLSTNLVQFIKEAQQLNITATQLITLIERGYER
ncbi:GntR family transcriptional regulator [Brochothrix campestris]|uniref:Bacterial regulatory protein, GntR family protein n=1 Tax=Brochothrix campestris FSL F6-1037 TaxID=1265861 RepID=W7CPW6_9LIST|nr:GntR family transcriptional regulator [Brochothrix campestris]EUJ34988.1 bacterial regulatory protein, GntR family protein [Brochothrix campestris FSL F6-1037]